MIPTSRIDGPPARVPIVDAQRDNSGMAVFGISVAIILMAVVVLWGWHAQISAVIQILPGLNQMQYNTALSFLALGAAGIGLSTSRRLVVVVGGSVAALMGAVVVLEHLTGRSFGIDTWFFRPWVTLGEFPGRMATTTAISFVLTGAALVVLAVRRTALGSFWMLNAIPLSLALTSVIGYAFRITYVLPFGLGLQMALHTAVTFTAYGIVMLGYAWKHAPRETDGLPKWASGISLAFLPVLLVATSALSPSQSWRVVLLEAVVSIGGVALTTLAMRKLATVKVANKGLLMTVIPLSLVVIFGRSMVVRW